MKHPRGHLCLLRDTGRLNPEQLGKDELRLGTAAPQPGCAGCPPPFPGKCAPHCWCKQRSGLCLRKKRESEAKSSSSPGCMQAKLKKVA